MQTNAKMFYLGDSSTTDVIGNVIFYFNTFLNKRECSDPSFA